MIKEILITRQHSFERDSGAKILRELVGDSVITREEPQHKERRRVLQPAFHKEQIGYYASVMVKACQGTSNHWLDVVSQDEAAAIPEPSNIWTLSCETAKPK